MRALGAQGRCAPSRLTCTSFRDAATQAARRWAGSKLTELAFIGPPAPLLQRGFSLTKRVRAWLVGPGATALRRHLAQLLDGEDYRIVWLKFSGRRTPQHR